MNVPIKNALRRLPYQEMKTLSKEIADKVGVEPQHIAEALTVLEIDTDFEKRDAMFLEMAFNRKKNITIQKHGDGYKVCIPVIPGAQVIGTDIRACVSQLFDLVVTYNALMSTG